MKKPLDLTNKKINNWNVKCIDEEKKQKRSSNYWICECDCGTTRSIPAHRLVNEPSKGCSNCFPNKIERTAHNRINLETIINNKYGSLKIIKESEKKKVAGQERRFVLCQCDCGNKKEIALKRLMSGHTKSCGCHYFNKDENGHSKSKRKSYRNKNGYIKIYVPDHFNADRNGYVLEHILIMSKNLGRPIREKETIHHKNGIRHDNRLENLELWSTHHAFGQRAEDLVDYAKEILEKYGNYQNPTKLFFQYGIKNPPESFNTSSSLNTPTLTSSSRI